MRIATDQLIAELERDIAPVRRLRPPMQRAALWLACVLAMAAVAIAAFANMKLFMHRADHPELLIELAGTLATGILATIAAFHLSLPDRSNAWLLLPLPSLGLWLAGSGAGCYRDWLRFGTDGSWAMGDSMDCLMFILGLGIPLAAALLWVLRQAKPLAPVRVAVMGALGAASLTAFLLQFFHPFDVTFMDLSVHAAAIALVVLIAAWRGAQILN